MTEAAPIPVTIVGGYLGAGKTTLVNHVLRHADGLRIAVLVNELGALAIDADLIESRDADMVSVAGGCVCCSYGSDLMAALMDLARREPRFDHVLLETSGVALPGPVAASLTLLADYVNDGIVIVADAAAIRRQSSDRYLSDTILQQLAGADIVLLNKVDTVDAEQLRALHLWLAETTAGARIVDTTEAAVPLDVVTGARLSAPAKPQTFALPPHQPDIYSTEILHFPEPADALQLAAALADPRLGLLRAKGIITGLDGRTWAIQIVGTRHRATPHSAPSETPSGIVCIGLKHQIDAARLHALANALIA